MGLLMAPMEAETRDESMEYVVGRMGCVKVTTMALMTEPERALRVSGKDQTKESLKAALTS